jgi:two-component system nitrate/nitrite response regulator NarL
MPVDRGLTRITVVDRHELFAEALDVALTLAGHRVHRVSAYEQALPTNRLAAVLQRSRARVVLLDPDLEDSDSTPVIRPLVQAGITVVVLTADADRARWGEWLVLGARTVMSKSSSLNAILSALRTIADGHAPLPRAERDRLIQHYYRERGEILARRKPLASLTQREREVLSHLIHGDNVSDIAKANGVAEATVRTQVKSILGKLGVTSQVAAVAVAYRARWRPPHPLSTPASHVADRAA